MELNMDLKLFKNTIYVKYWHILIRINKEHYRRIFPWTVLCELQIKYSLYCLLP